MNQLLPLLILGAAGYFAYQRGLLNNLFAPAPAPTPGALPPAGGGEATILPIQIPGGTVVPVLTTDGGATIVPAAVPAPASVAVGAPAVGPGGIVAASAPTPVPVPIPVTPLEQMGGSIATGFGTATQPTQNIFAPSVAPATVTASGVQEDVVEVPASAVDEIRNAFADPRGAAYSPASQWIFNWREWNYIARTVAQRPGHNLLDVPIGYRFPIGDLFTMWTQRGLSGAYPRVALGGIVRTGYWS